MITIIETSQFIGKAAKVLTAAEKDELMDFLARHPASGDVIPRTGGVRKLRFGAKGKGKSGGVRVIYYYYDKNNPLLIFTVFGKGEKTNLTAEEENALYGIVQKIKKEMKK